MRSVGILIFNEVEVLDFAGPFEVFSVTGRRDGSNPFDVFTVSEDGSQVAARNGLVVTPKYSFADGPPADILVIPGGYGTRREMLNQNVLNFVSEQALRAEIILSVCTGALILGRAGLLDGIGATTHHGAIEELRLAAPHAHVLPHERLVDNGKIVVAAGVSSGIDASFYVVARLLGRDVAEETARYIEYPLSLATPIASSAR